MVQNQETEVFKKQVNYLIEKGHVKNYTELVGFLEWNTSMLSDVMNGRRNAPKYIIAAVSSMISAVINNQARAQVQERNKGAEEAILRTMQGLTEIEGQIRQAISYMVELSHAIENKDEQNIRVLFQKVQTSLVVTITRKEAATIALSYVTNLLKDLQIQFDTRRVPVIKDNMVVEYREPYTPMNEPIGFAHKIQTFNTKERKFKQKAKDTKSDTEGKNEGDNPPNGKDNTIELE